MTDTTQKLSNMDTIDAVRYRKLMRMPRGWLLNAMDKSIAHPNYGGESICEALDKVKSIPHDYKVSPLDAHRVSELAAVKAEPITPFAWAIFDGEGGYDFLAYENNENYRDEYIAKNGEKYAGWVVPLFEAVKALQVANDAFESIARLYNYEDSTGTLASKMYDARCIAIIARDEIKSLMGNLNG